MKKLTLAALLGVILCTTTIPQSAHAGWHTVHFVLHLVWPTKLDDPNKLYGPWPLP